MILVRVLKAAARNSTRCACGSSSNSTNSSKSPGCNKLCAFSSSSLLYTSIDNACSRACTHCNRLL